MSNSVPSERIRDALSKSYKELKGILFLVKRLREVKSVYFNVKGFNLPDNLESDTKRFVSMMKEIGKEREAIKLAEEISSGLQKILTAFFKGSPSFFERLYQSYKEKFSRKEFDTDIEWRIKQAINEETVLMAKTEIDIVVATNVYCGVYKTLEEAISEQCQRNKKRDEEANKQAAKQRIEEHKRLLEKAKKLDEEANGEERKRRAEMADNLLELLS